MQQKKSSFWFFAILSLGFLLFSGSLAFASFPIGWIFQVSPDVKWGMKPAVSPEAFSLKLIQEKHPVEESYLFEYEAWRRIRTSA